MTIEEAKKILQIDLKIMEKHKCSSNSTEPVKMAISALGAIEQYRWERDVAISQLEELGLSLGQKVDGVYLTYDKYNELLEYKYMYEDLCK